MFVVAAIFAATGPISMRPDTGRKRFKILWSGLEFLIVRLDLNDFVKHVLLVEMPRSFKWIV